MNTFLSFTAAVAISGAAMIANAAAMPVAKLDTQAQQPAASMIQDVHWVCGPYRCWWRPNYYNYYGPPWRPYYHPYYRPYYRRWGW